MYYANKREAQLGDLVVGYGYNTADQVVSFGETDRPRKRLVGTLVKAIPDTDRCNAEIEWIESVPVDAPRPRMAQGEARLVVLSGVPRAHWVCRDYTHVGALLHVEDVISLDPVDDGSQVAKLAVVDKTPAATPPVTEVAP